MQSEQQRMSVDSILLTVHGDSVLLPVRAQPGARRTGVVGLHGGCLKIAVSAAPEKGKANAALVEAIAKAFELKRSQVTLHRGDTSSQKLFRLEGLTVDAARAILTRLLTDAAS